MNAQSREHNVNLLRFTNFTLVRNTTIDNKTKNAIQKSKKKK